MSKTKASKTEAESNDLVELANIPNFVWSLSDVLRGDFRESEYMLVILPWLLLRRLECLKPGTPGLTHLVLAEGDLRQNVLGLMQTVRERLGEAIEIFDIEKMIERLHKAKLLSLMVRKFVRLDLGGAVSSVRMGNLFEELLRRYALGSGDSSGEFYTPRDAVRLIANLLIALPLPFNAEQEITLYDPTAGTGGMLSIGADLISATHNRPVLAFGQELSAQSQAMCAAEFLMAGKAIGQIALGNTLTDDAFAGRTFAYQASNPPYGVDWKKYAGVVWAEHGLGELGRFPAGLPRTSDGSLLFVQHCVSKLRPVEQGGGRAAIILSNSPLFSGDAGSGESDIRCWLLQHDLLEALVRLPDEMFYNTGIGTNIWLITNIKRPELRGKVMLVDAAKTCQPMRRKEGSKKNELTEDHIAQIVSTYVAAQESDTCKGLDATAFMHREITVERPKRLRFDLCDERLTLLKQIKSLNKQPMVLQMVQQAIAALPDHVFLSWSACRSALQIPLGSIGAKLTTSEWVRVRDALGEPDENAEPLIDDAGHLVADPKLRDTEHVPYGEDVDAYLARMVLPHNPDAWIDPTKTVIGSEINLNRWFYKHEDHKHEPLDKLMREMLQLQMHSNTLMAEMAAGDAKLFGWPLLPVDAMSIDHYWAVCMGDPLKSKPIAVFADYADAQAFAATRPGTQMCLFSDWRSLYPAAQSVGIPATDLPNVMDELAALLGGDASEERIAWAVPIDALEALLAC